MKNTKNYFAASLVLVAVTSNAVVAQAEGYARADALAAKSLASALGGATLSTLVRQPAARDLVVRQLSAAVCKGDCATVVQDTAADRVRVRGAQWHLDIYGDGSMAEFVDEAVSAGAHSAGVEPKAVMSRASLEALGRAYIANSLSSSIVLGPNETLVANTASNRTEGGVGVDGVRAPDRVTGQRVVFSREIGGVAVVGLGSKVVLTFLNDGKLESFRYDWPVYTATGVSQPTVSAQEVIGRLQRLLGARTAQSGSTPIVHPLPPTASGTVDLSSDVQLHRLECGYYDAGLLTRGSAPVQAGCVYHGVHFLNGAHRGRAGVAGAVPAAANPHPDGQWAEEAALRGIIASGGAAPTAATPDSSSRPSSPRQP
jgi:hypothetical protein